MFLLVAFALIVVILIWRTLKRYPSKIIMQPTEENQCLVNQCASLAEYRPTPWICSGHLMTIFGVFFRTLPSMLFERLILTVDNMGGSIALDWHRRPHHGQPILVLLHGLTGGSHDQYIRWMILAASSQLDLCCVVVHARGCGRSKLTSPKSFCATNTDDVRASLKYIRSLVGDETPIFVVGYSLGASILTKYLGEESDQCSLQGAIACCASFDMHLSTNNLERWFYVHLYNRRLTINLLRYLRLHEEHFSRSDSEVSLNLHHAYKAKTVREFDTHVIVPQFGFRDVEHYYTEASPKQHLKSIRIPTLILSAIDDPICPISGLSSEDVLQNPNIIAVETLEGGHVSYLQGWWPKSFSYDNIVVVDYLKARLKQMNYHWEKQTDKESIIDIKNPEQ